MSKKVKAIRNIIKRNHRGFSMIELLTAIGILGVLSGAVVFAMNSSSKTYSRLSVEAQLQSEAQLVANMITELAVDSMDAQSTVASTYNMSYDEDAGKILVLESVLDSVKKQYVIGKKTGSNKLYLAERTFDATTNSWGTLSEALLGEYIDGFSVDTSRVENENILRFTLAYKKNGRTYNGNYQVLMRNRAYADPAAQSPNPEGGTLLSVNVNPQVVYVDIVGDQVTQYFNEEVADSNRVTNVSSGVEFNATVQTNSTSADKTTVDWTLERADGEVFELSNDSSLQTYITWDNKKKLFKNSPVDAFVIRASKTVTLSDGTTPLTRSKTGMILLRRIKGLSLYALSGTTQWKSEFETVYEGVPTPEAQGYAYAGSNNKYLPINFNAALSASNIPYGGGLTWKLYMQNASGNWEELDAADSSYASLAHEQTITSTSNVVTLGNNASNGQVYKIVAISDFDNSYSAEYIFGVAPNSIPERDGYNSRGFYTSMDSYWKGKAAQGDHVLIDKILWLECLSISGGNLAEQIGVTTSNGQVTSINRRIDKIKIIKDEENVWRFYVDFDAFAYGKQQKETFYSGDADIYLVALYRGVDGKYYLAGNNFNGLGDFKNFACAQTGINPDDIQNAYSAALKYELLQVTVTKVEPTNDVIVIPKGKDKVVDVKTSYYNLVSPRRGAHYLGVFLDDMDTNLMQDGMGTTNAYFDVHMTSRYGDTDKYVDEVVLNVVAKADQKKYPTDPLTLRVTANDYYMINPSSPNSNSYTDYKVLVANVEGTDVYIPGPDSKESGFAWPTAANTAKAQVDGYNSAGNKIKATVYKSGSGYYCTYAGRTYTYSSGLRVWKK